MAPIVFLLIIALCFCAPALAESPEPTMAQLIDMEQRGEDEKALLLTEQALKKWPKCMFFYIFRARALGSVKRYDEALRLCHKAKAMSPTLFEIEDARSEIYNAMGKSAEAIAACTAALKLFPEDIGGRRLRARIYRQTGKLDLATADMTYLMNYEKAHHGAASARCRDLELRGNMYMENKQYQQAVDDFSALIKERIGYAEGYRLRASAYKAMGRTEEAKRDLYRASQTGDDWAPPSSIGR